MLFPSQDWIEEYGNRVNQDEEYAKAAEDWGVGYNGDFVFIIRDIPVDELDYDEIPDDIVDMFETYVDDDGTGYGFLALEGGECQDARLINDPDEVEHGFELIGSYDEWKGLARGDVDPIQAMMSGKIELNGDMQKVMQYNQAAQRLATISSEIPVEFVDEKFA